MAEAENYYQMSLKQVYEALETSDEGLTKEAAERRLAEHGGNELITSGQKPKWLILLQQFKDLLVIVLLVAGIISYGLAIYSALSGNEYWPNLRDGSVMFFIVLINAVIGFFQEYKARRIVEQLRELIRSPTDVVRGGQAQEIDQRKLVPGDVVNIEEGDKIPADLRIIKASNLRTNEFSLTGESMPQDKVPDAIADKRPLADRDNMAFVGTTVASGTGVGIVVRTGMDTELGKIATMTEEATELKSPLQNELTALALRLTLIVVAISALLFVFALVQNMGLLVSATYALGIAVACVPQALPAQLTVAMSTASRRLAEKNAIVKSLPSVETLGSTNVICTDKTGTLTKNEMTVRRCWFDQHHYRFTGEGYKPEGDILDEADKKLSQEQIDAIEIMMDAATMASNAEIHEPDEDHPNWYPVGDPTEAALITMSTKIGTRSPEEDKENPEVQEFPFESERKRMSSVRQYEDGNILTLKGATSSILPIATRIYRDGEARELTEEDKKKIHEVEEEFSSQALRVLAIASRELPPTDTYEQEEVERKVTFLGLVGMIDPPREGVAEAIKECHEAKIDTLMITGDHATTARAIAEEIGLAEDGAECPVITGQEMEDLDDEKLVAILEKHQAVVFCRVSPSDKLRIVTVLEDKLNRVVAVTGDGVNDAPALKRAHIGVAMGQTGTDVAKEAAEVVLLDDSFPTLVHAVEEGRTIYNNISKVVLASLTTNTAELVAVLIGLVGIALGNYAIPILAIQILAIDLLAEIMPLTFLCFDPPAPELMKEEPRSRKKHILNLVTGSEVAFFGVLIGALAAGNFFLYMSRHGITLNMADVGGAAYARASAMTWLTIAFCQFVNILSRRYHYRSFFHPDTFTRNKILSTSILGSIILTLIGVYAPVVSDFLQFTGIQVTDWLYVFAAAGVFLFTWEILKVIRRAKRGAAVRSQ